MPKITIRKDKMYPYYYIDEDPSKYDSTIDLPIVIMEDYEKIMTEFSRIQHALREMKLIMDEN